MSLIKIYESDDFIVDYDKERRMYRVSYFEDHHFKDEIWFDAYEEKEFNELFKLLPLARGWNACLDTIIKTGI